MLHSVMWEHDMEVLRIETEAMLAIQANMRAEQIGLAFLDTDDHPSRDEKDHDSDQ